MLEATTSIIAIKELLLGFRFFIQNAFLILVGNSGVGKTSLAIQFAKQIGVLDCRESSEGGDVYVLNLSGASPTEVSGLGIPDPASPFMTMKVPYNLPSVERLKITGNGDPDRPVLLVLDEFSQWDVAIQSQFRSCRNPNGLPMVGDHVLGSGVKIVITANRFEDGSSSVDQEFPIVGRSKKFILQTTFEDFSVHASKHDWGMSRIHAYLRFIADLDESVDGKKRIDTVFAPPTPMPYNGSPWPCPRQWEILCRDEIGIMEDESLTEADRDTVLKLSVEGAVGAAHASSVMAFLNTFQKVLPTFKAIRAGKDSITNHDADRMAILSLAMRVAVKEAKDIGIKAKTGAAVKGGKFDWIVDQFLLPLPNELTRWGAECLERYIDLKSNHKDTNTLFSL